MQRIIIIVSGINNIGPLSFERDAPSKFGIGTGCLFSNKYGIIYHGWDKAQPEGLRWPGSYPHSLASMVIPAYEL